MPLTQKPRRGTLKPMPRKKKFTEATIARFRAGTFERIANVLTADEDRTDFFRQAVDKELERREAKPPASGRKVR